MSERFEVDADVRVASTLPADFYRDPACYEQQIERVFAASWQLAAWTDLAPAPRSVAPLTLLEGCLDEPLLMTHDDAGERRCLSNVCTHRGAILVDAPATCGTIRCRYHGRRFQLDGRIAHMPEFEDAQGFPSPSDDLPRVACARLGPLTFASLRAACSFDEWLGPLRQRLSFVPWASLTASDVKSYELPAHWALYCDNYLEGLHIPFVHPTLAEGLDYGAYTTETLPWASLQIGVGKGGEAPLELPADHPDHGRGVSAYYAFLFPSTMINVYRWGVSINAVQPLGPGRTRVVYVSLVSDPTERALGVGGDLHRVELEDQAVVASVQRGVRSRLYRRGRFSPTREVGVHHFHRLLARALSGDD